MSVGFAIQTALYEAMVGDPDLAEIIGGRVYDQPPTDAEFPFVSFGPSSGEERDLDCLDAGMERFQIDFWSRDGAGAETVRRIGDALRALLHNGELTAPDINVVDMHIVDRRTMLDADGVTMHGLVVIEIEHN